MPKTADQAKEVKEGKHSWPALKYIARDVTDGSSLTPFVKKGRRHAFLTTDCRSTPRAPMDSSTHALNMFKACIREAATNTLLHKKPSHRLMQNHKFTWLHICAVRELNRIRRTMRLSMHLKGPNSSTDTYVYHGKKFTIQTSETPDTEEYCIEVGDEGMPL
jgi:hypothetical protein